MLLHDKITSKLVLLKFLFDLFGYLLNFLTMFDKYRMLMNYTLRFVLLILFIVYFVSAQECSESLSLLEMPVNLLQYRGSVGIFNNRNFFVQSKFSHFSYLSDNSTNNNNTNLTIGLLFLLNKIALVLLLLNLMFVFKGNGSKHKKSPLFRPYFPHLSHVTCFIGFIYF